MALRHAKAGEAIDLWQRKGALSAGKSAALVKTDDFEVVQLVVPSGRELPEHHVDGPITLYCLEGSVRLGLLQGDVELRAGEWLYLQGGEKHSVSAIEDSRVLLTIVLKH